MQPLSFLLIIATGIVVMLLSLMLDYLWAQVLPLRSLYYTLRFPGVVIHECSHVLGCLLTGAEIQKIVLFSEGGGSVTYARPKIPLLGDVIISTAPVFCIPLVLALCTWAFAQYLGCIFPAFPFPLDSVNLLAGVVTGIFGMFEANLLTRFDHGFFSTSISRSASSSPSRRACRISGMQLRGLSSSLFPASSYMQAASLR